jgi:hypothetical protein
MFNKSEIMTAAWVIVRRFAGNRETHAQRIARALKYVWWKAKEAARELAARVAAAPASPARPVAEIRADLFAFECKDTLRGSDWTHLDALRGELAQALAA